MKSKYICEAEMYEPEEVAAIPSTSMTSSAEPVWQFNATNFRALSALLTLKFENEKNTK